MPRKPSYPLGTMEPTIFIRLLRQKSQKSQNDEILALNLRTGAKAKIGGGFYNMVKKCEKSLVLVKKEHIPKLVSPTPLS